jgi:putative oxidoreductase
MQKTTRIIDWLFRIAIAVILLQTLYFKFTGHPESVALFSKLGVEPWGRIGTSVIELIAGILILVPATALIGAALSLGLMAGAIASHLFVIGIESDNDGGQLFMLAIIVLALSLVVLAIRRKEIPVWFARLKKTS